ncbi:MAG: hypothetical protein KA004_13035 [Verrucomicrobiales bacterium]|nr:hypothetical protein [Verrucomicrobiales bacterium]
MTRSHKFFTVGLLVFISGAAFYALVTFNRPSSTGTSLASPPGDGGATDQSHSLASRIGPEPSVSADRRPASETAPDINYERAALVQKLINPRYLAGEPVPPELEAEFRAALAAAKTLPDRILVYRSAPPSLLRLVKPELMADYQAARDPKNRGHLSDMFPILQKVAKGDTALGECLLDDIRDILQAVDAGASVASPFNTMELRGVVSTLAAVNDPNQMNLVATLIVNAPPDTQKYLIQGLAQSSNIADFNFLMDVSEKIPYAANAAQMAVHNVRQKRIALLFFGKGVTVATLQGDWIPSSREKREALASELASQEVGMISALKERGVDPMKILPPMPELK